MAPADLVLRFTPKALADLDGIWGYTCQQWSFEQARKYHNEIIDALDKLRHGQASWQTAEHVRHGYLKYRVGAHVVFFTVSNGFLDVVRILHARMDVNRHISN